MISFKRRCFHCKFCLLILLLFIISFVSPSFCEENISSTISKISGYVIDAASGVPIQNASIIINSLYHLNTDNSGFFSFETFSEGWYNIYVFYDKPETGGIDYVPSLWKIYIEKGVNAYKMLALWPGASIKIEGKIRFVDKPLPASWFKFTIQPPGGISWGDEYSVDEYGTIDFSKDLGIEPDLIIIPANIPVSIMVEARLPDGTHKVFNLLSETAGFVLKQGSQETLNIEKFCLKLNVEYVRDLLNQNIDSLREAINAGFLVEEEQKRVHKAESLLNSLEAFTSEGSYEEAFAMLRNAYVLSKSTLEELKSLFIKSSQTSVFSIFIISLLSLTITYLMAERGTKLKISLIIGEGYSITAPLRAVVAPTIYISLLILFFISFPGCRLISPVLFILAAFFLFVTSLVTISVLPKILEGKKHEDRSISGGSLLTFAFSIASGNLKRRKIRSSLNILSITILVFGFIVFTSISPGYGFTSICLGSSKTPLNIAMISNPPIIPESGFTSLPEDLVKDLESNPKIILVSPKIENFPSLSPIGYLYSLSGKSKPIYGLLGISAKREAVITRLNETIVEGRYFNDEEDESVLISKSLAEYLGIKVQESIRIFGREFKVIGLFSDESIEKILEINGRSFLPYRLQTTPGGIYVTQCWGDEVVIMNIKTALSLPNTAISRIYIQPINSSDLLKVSDTIVLTRDCVAWVSFEGSLYKKYIGEYLEEKGMALMPFTMILSILILGSMMFRSIEERKHEIFILSSIGLNPTHIAALFFAEALIIGFISGGLGYFFGFSGYRIIGIVGPLEIKEKVSLEWSMIALFFSSLTSVLATLIPALKASTIVTPSYLRKLRVGEEEKPKREGEPWVIELPIKIKRGEIDFFCIYVERKLKEKSEGMVERVEKLEVSKEKRENDYLRRKIFFEYIGGEMKRQLRSFNELIMERRESDIEYKVYLLCVPDRNFEEAVLSTSMFIRRIILEWNALKPTIVTPFESTLTQIISLIRFFNPKLLYIVTEENISSKIEELKKLLEKGEITVPQISVICLEAPATINDYVRRIEDAVLEAEAVCVSGESTSICVALTLAASKLKKPICYVAPQGCAESSSQKFKVIFLE